MANFPAINVAQAALISYLKSISALNAALTTPTTPSGSYSQIKEYFWQGQDFSYPAVRLQMGAAKPEVPEPRCGLWKIPFYIMCFSEQKSSQECSMLESIIVSTIHGFQPGLMQTIDFHMFYVDQVVPPIRQDELTWRSEVIAHTSMDLWAGQF
jgi:hypothetical protein